MTSVLIAVTLAVAGCGATTQTQPGESGNTDSTDDPAFIVPIPLKVAILGDSYTTGTGTTTPNSRYTARVCPALAWQCENNAQPGTGYTNAGAATENYSVYLDRTDAVIASRPDVVVVQGGTYDSDNSFNGIQTAADAVFSELRQGLPDAKLVAVGTTNPPAIKDGRELVVRDALLAACELSNVLFVDPIAEQWLNPDDYIAADGLHPTDGGYAKYAARWIDDMKQIGVAGPKNQQQIDEYYERTGLSVPTR